MRPAPDWRPGASPGTLELGAAVRSRLRAHLDGQGVLEVTTPVLSRAAASDPAIESLATAPTRTDPARWLQTSPESAAKRLLAAHGRDLWQMGPVFRAGERGRRHNVEFTLLEWYRVGLGLEAVMADVEAAVRAAAGARATPGAPVDGPGVDPDRVGAVLPGPEPFARLSHGELVREVAGDWPERLSVADVERLFAERGASWPAAMDGDDPDAAIDLLFDEFVLPALAPDRFAFVTGWPASRASLARVATDGHGRAVAARFELYAGDLELANGYHELADAAEQRRRFEADLARRAARGQPPVPLDEPLLGALGAGLPDCSGVALGVERLLMALSGIDDIDAVTAFSDARA